MRRRIIARRGLIVASVLLLASCYVLLALIAGEPSTYRVKEASTSPDGMYTALASVRLPRGMDDEKSPGELSYSLKLRRNIGGSAGEETQFLGYSDSGYFRPEFKFAWQDNKNLKVQYRDICFRTRGEDVGEVHIQWVKMPGFRPDDPDC